MFSHDYTTSGSIFEKSKKKVDFLLSGDVPIRALWGLYFTWLYRETFSEPKMIFFSSKYFFLKNVLDSEIKIFISKSMFLNNFFLYCIRQKWILQNFSILGCCSFIFRPSSLFFSKPKKYHFLPIFKLFLAYY